MAQNEDYKIATNEKARRRYETSSPIARRLSIPVSTVAMANTQSSCEYINRICVPFGIKEDDQEAFLARAPEPTGRKG